VTLDSTALWVDAHPVIVRPCVHHRLTVTGSPAVTLGGLLRVKNGERLRTSMAAGRRAGLSDPEHVDSDVTV
jgi:hypothetical protein